jgi:hypothetical protein
MAQNVVFIILSLWAWMIKNELILCLMNFLPWPISRDLESRPYPHPIKSIVPNRVGVNEVAEMIDDLVMPVTVELNKKVEPGS